MMPMNKPKILITNDDGIRAPGIHHLWNALKEVADLTVVAPSQEKSAQGMSVSLRAPLKVVKYEWPLYEDDVRAYYIDDGSPADCVKLAVNVILNEKPDLIISGINRGNNGGRNVLYSGTVAAVIEGTFNGIPGIAFSCADYHDPAFDVAENYIPTIVEYQLEHPLPTGSFLNVNFPTTTHRQINGFKYTRQGKQYIKEDPDRRIHPYDGYEYYWLGTKIARFEEHEDSDIAWLEKGYITAAPIKISELTDHAIFMERKNHFESYFIT